MLSENYQAFADIVRSRFLIAEKHRDAEQARKAANAIAHTDYLTGLPNRRRLQSLLSARVEAGPSAPPFAVGLLDLDGFKPINDIRGHPVGDEILKEVANRLAAAMRERGAAARMGGDEFAVICDGVRAPDEALAIGRELQSIFAAPFVVDQLTIHLNCTFGFALFPALATEADQLVRLADVALYRAKASRRGDVGVFDISDENAAIARTTLEQALHRALANGAIGVHFQPIVDLATGRVTRSIVDRCRRLDLPCVAEGIEYPDQLEELKLGGCAGGQGWLFARAMPEAMVAEFIEERRATTL
jgi:diguanylate cyclase (GGDEF)-like protein